MDVFYLTLLLSCSFGFHSQRPPVGEADTFPYRSKALSATVSGAGLAEAWVLESVLQWLLVKA
jgi:hypothetical protein